MPQTTKRRRSNACSVKHLELILRLLPWKDPNTNPVERLVNRGLSSAVQCNRCYSDIEMLRSAAGEYLRSYYGVYAQ